MNRRWWIALAALGLAAAGGLATADEAKKKDANLGSDAKKAEGADGPARYALGVQLAERGEKDRDALLLLSAARLLKGVEVKDAQREKQVEDGPKAAQAEKEGVKKPDPAPTPASLIAKARALAAGDATIEALAQAIESEKPKGLITGPVRHADCVRGYTRHRFTGMYRAGEVASVLVDGDGDADLDLYVYDENNNLIGSDADLTDTCLVEWVPRWTGSFTIVVENVGGRTNCYWLHSN
jgi:hypothetical protein